jgi:hypothetical protein
MTKFTFAILALLACLAYGVQAQEPSPPPLFYYNFDSESNGELNDESGRGNHGMLQGAATLTSNNAGHPHNTTGSALDLAAAGDYVSVLTAANGALDTIQANNQATVSFWINGGPDQPADNWTFLADPGRQLGSHAPWSDSTIYFDVGGCCNANQRISRTADPTDFMDQWNHYAFVKDEAVSSIYINGELFHSSHPYTDRDGVEQPGQGGDKLPLGAITSFTLGGGANGENTHIGLFDDWAVWDIALTPARIADLAEGGDVIVEFLEGDFDGNGTVGVEDFNLLAMNLGAHLVGPVTYGQGDINFSQTVDLDDFREFKAVFPGVVAAATGVPEPASVVLLVLSIVALLPLSRRRSKRN